MNQPHRRSPKNDWRYFVGLPIAVGAVVISFLFTGTAQAQLPQDVRDVFEGMLDSLDEDLQKKFQDAIDKDTDRVEFTADEFLRFRDNPANPFEGLDRVQVKKGGGNVALKFELPSMRNRDVSFFERQNQNLLSRLEDPIQSIQPSIVRIYSGKRQIALGAVVANNRVVTKASEVANRDNIRCQLHNGRWVDAKVGKQNEENDLVILQLPTQELSPIRWLDKQPALGTFLLTPDGGGSLVAMGSYSVHPRSTALGERAFLGVQPMTSKAGVQVFDIRPGSASHRAGLRNGDVITKIDATPMRDVAALVAFIRSRKPGDKIEIDYLRNFAASKTTATLAGNKISGERAARFKMMSRLGAVPSRRSNDFPNVFQHDTPLFPEHCGGPIVDLDGHVVGLNIARQGRASTLAIPAKHAKLLIERMLSESVAKAK